MKRITDKEYKEFSDYITARNKGQILTPHGLRLICEYCGCDALRVGEHFLSVYNRFCIDKTDNPTIISTTHKGK